MAGALDRRRELALVLGAGPGLPPRPDLAAVGQKPSQHVHLLEIDVGNLLLTEIARLAAPAEPATAAPPVGTTSPALPAAPRRRSCASA